MLKAVNISKSFARRFVKSNSVPVLRGVNIEIPAGQTAGLMGNSGGGKSTLARILLGLLSADSGQVFFDGKDITNISGSERVLLRRKMQIVFQNPESALNPRMTILQNLLEPMAIQRMYSEQPRRDLISEYLERVGISQKLLTRYPREISGGEAQRVMLARILTLKPKFIVLDEPTSMLDMSVQAQILTLLKQLQREMELTYLLISHDLEITHWFSDRVYTLENGRAYLA
ncbi:MAG: dipeptide/oligopeptide/nickel ABC transporter ATP-binding protein [Oscillospiraceae bacterium]|jgi:ABC-type glutathione transport system ATPase component|nr:dipeptide/oligopeptide/nickel ABC transporter ATP-binding protein [Oscillospiraceae bacterium]